MITNGLKPAPGPKGCPGLAAYLRFSGPNAATSKSLIVTARHGQIVMYGYRSMD